MRKQRNLLGRLASFLAMFALFTSGSMFTHAAEIDHHHNGFSTPHEGSFEPEGNHHHSDAPEEQNSQSPLIHCGANILALIANLADLTIPNSSIEQFPTTSVARPIDRSTDPPPPRTISRLG